MLTIIEIKALENGAHRNQSWEWEFGTIPEGYAVIPENMETENFPFGEVTVEKIGGVMTVTKWTPGTMPEVIEPKKTITTNERLAALEAAMLEMVLGGAE